LKVRSILHIDMDAFYASVEQRDNPELQGKPVIVGGHPRRGVVLAASYEVRKFGVRSALPMARAIALAPQAIVVAPRFHAYVEASEAVFRVFESVTPLVEPLSLDEAFLDVSASVGLFGAPADIARALRKRIRDELHLPASAGISDVKFVAKIASDLAKPDGQAEVPPGTAREFLAPLPVWRLWGVGQKTEAQLERLGLATIGQVAAKELPWLVERLGAAGQHLWELSQGLDSRVVVPDREAKSVGAQDTFDEDLRGEAPLRPHVHSQALRVGRRLRHAGLKARAVQLTVKYGDFSSLTRRRTLEEPTDDGQQLYREALALLTKVDLGRAVRLTGVAGQELTRGDQQLGLFAAQPKRADQLNSALDRITAKFGTKAIGTADLAEEKVDAPRDGFYREQKRELAGQAEQQRALEGPRVELDEGFEPVDCD
jgi:DNA polymerase-4